MTTSAQITLFNTRFTNIIPASTQYATSKQGITNAMAKPRKTQYKTVNQLLKECPLVGTTKLGLNFIA